LADRRGPFAIPLPAQTVWHPGIHPLDGQARAMDDEMLPQEVFKSAKFCSMRVTRDIRKMAEKAELPMAAK